MTTIDVTVPTDQEWTNASVLSWFVNTGESIREGEPLVELETEKVAFEVVAPVSGVLIEKLLDADAKVSPGAILAKMREAETEAQQQHEQANNGAGSDTHSNSSAKRGRASAREHRLSPSVKRLVREHDLDPAMIEGTGRSKRLTRRDIENYLARQQPVAEDDAGNAANAKSPGVAIGDFDGASSQQIPHSAMRRRIAEHMSNSVATAPHVTAIFEADFSNVIAHRNAAKPEYAAKGIGLTFTAYIVAACVQAMKIQPAVNSRWHDDFLEVFADVNVGVGVALPGEGLIVPVLRAAQALSLFGIAEHLQQLTDKAREGKLKPEDVSGGTFTISNHGTSGSLVASPIIINQPQSAILGVGKLEKRVVARSVEGQDAIQVRPMAFVSLTIDHRVLDGAQTNAWLSEFVRTIEEWPPL